MQKQQHAGNFVDTTREGALLATETAGGVLPGAPGRTRTCNRRLRRPVLYPVELRAQREDSRIVPAAMPRRVGMVGVEGFEPPTSCSQSRRAERPLPWPVLQGAPEAKATVRRAHGSRTLVAWPAHQAKATVRRAHGSRTLVPVAGLFINVWVGAKGGTRTLTGLPAGT